MDGHRFPEDAIVPGDTRDSRLRSKRSDAEKTLAIRQLGQVLRRSLHRIGGRHGVDAHSDRPDGSVNHAARNRHPASCPRGQPGNKSQFGEARLPILARCASRRRAIDLTSPDARVGGRAEP